MNSTLHNKVKVYNLTSGKSLPEWIQERKKNKQKLSGEGRIELLNDFEFPHFTRCLFRTANGTNIFAAGDYPPRLKCFDVTQLSIKYSFNADMPIMSGVSLSSDFKKFALRGEGRTLTVHHSAAVVDRLRVPHTQRCLTYHENNCDLLSGGNSADIHRFNLDSGAFIDPFTTSSEEGVNSIEVFPRHGLVLAACENGVVEAWDPRGASRAGVTNIGCLNASSVHGLTGTNPAAGEGCAVTHVSVDDGESGLHFACGTSTGQVALYDIRLNKPLLVKDHMNSLPIVKTYFFRGKSNIGGERTHIISADTRSIKVWNRQTGANFTTLESPGVDVYDFIVLKAQHNIAYPFESDDSGVICMACDTPKVQVQFVPQLGIAPNWASFLDGITEELEDKDTTVVFDDYKFIPKDEMDKLGIKGTDVEGGKVRPAMHGCYIESRLYRELKAVVDPAAFNRQQQENAKNKSKLRQENRISHFIKSDPTKDAATGGGDSRFAARVQQDPAFAVDTNNSEYSKLRAKIEEKKMKGAEKQKKHDEAHFRVVARDEEYTGAVGYGNDDETDGRGAGGTFVDGARNMLKGMIGQGSNLGAKRVRAPSSADAGVAGAGGELHKSAMQGGGAGAGGRTVRMEEAKPGAKYNVTAKQSHAVRKQDKVKKMTLEQRLALRSKK
eukprot:TRINITY_DN23610_c0_g1_i4.p1 TRINITY_DN23610_c0_g1~~TRINITY_DN23610_c0_g1_i4.p1  ORF type:complete len:666 (+),score=201.25 TRINITY_DN23610_c0_g1_i4:247-2244(+)